MSTTWGKPGRQASGAKLALAPPLLIGIASFGLRAWLLAARPLWYDEAFTILFSRAGFNAMVYGTLAPVGGAAADVHPIAYYLLIYIWTLLAGHSPLAVRAVSAFAGVLTVVLLFSLCRLMFGYRPALSAMALAAFSPFHVYHSQEARMYALLGLWAVLAVWCVVRLARARGNRLVNVALLALAASLALYMHTLAAIFLLVLGLAALLGWRLFREMAAAGFLAAIFYLPWLVFVPAQMAKLRTAYWVAQPTPVSLLQTLLIFHSGEELLESAPSWLWLPLAAGLLALALLSFTVWQAWRRRLPEAGRVAFAFSLALGPAALLFLISFAQPVYLHRALLPALLSYCGALGWMIGKLPRLIAVVLLVAVAAASLAGLAAHFDFDQFPRPNFPLLANFLRQEVQPGDLIVHSNKLTMLPMVYYEPDLPQTYIGDPPGAGSDTLAYPTQQVLGLYARPDVEAAAGGTARIWLIIFERAAREYLALGYPTHPHLAWLEAHYRQIGLTQFGDLIVYEFGQ